MKKNQVFLYNRPQFPETSLVPYNRITLSSLFCFSIILEIIIYFLFYTSFYTLDMNYLYDKHNKPFFINQNIIEVCILAHWKTLLFI
jgi:hypothetical protein